MLWRLRRSLVGRGNHDALRKHHYTISQLLVGVLLCVWTPFGMAQTLTPGHWEGSFDAPQRHFTLVIEMSNGAAGWSARIHFPEAGLADFQLPKFEVRNQAVTFAIPPGWGLAMFRDIGLRPEEEQLAFEGTLTSPTEITGRLTVSKRRVPLVLRKLETHLPYPSEDVEVRNGDVQLAGSLLLPPGGGKHPVVVFTHGSDTATRAARRYEADLLVRNGIGALIYDKRGAGGSKGANWEVATLDELADDAQAWVEYLAKRKDMDAQHIGLYGLSQGTWIIAKVAARCPKVAFVISVSGSGVSVWEQDLFRSASLMRVHGFSPAEIEAAQAFMRQKFAVGKTGLGWDALKQRMDELSAEKVQWYPEYTGTASSIVSPRFWWLAFFSYDPAAALSRIKVPVLGLLGQRDLSFPATRVK